MIDELHELRRTDPIDPGSLGAAVSVDRAELLELLEADADRGRPRLRVIGGGADRSTNRAGYMAAMAAAAALVVGFVIVGNGARDADLDVIAPADGEPADAIGEQRGGPDPATDESNVVITVDDETDAAPDTAIDGGGSDATVATSTASTETSAADTTSTSTAVGGTPATAFIGDGSFDPSVDLVSLHFDHAHVDDGQATVAALAVVAELGLDPHVVSGTRSIDSGDLVHDLEPVMEAAWGDRWINARVDRRTAVDRTADRWLATIDGGGRVWVAEGGVSDFTAEVVRELQARRPNLDTVGSVHVVQHSRSNENTAVEGDLAFVATNTTYERIEDGNTDNATADLNQPADGFEEDALGSRNSDSWAVAFEYLPASRLDFSDTVALLHILGIGVDEIADPADFAERFIR